MNNGNNYTRINKELAFSYGPVNPVFESVGLTQLLFFVLFFHIFVSNAFICIMHSLKLRCFDPTAIVLKKTDH